jgi:hypothetical protein
MELIVEWVKNSGELKPTGTPTGEDVTEAIRRKARELGYGEVGFTRKRSAAVDAGMDRGV